MINQRNLNNVGSNDPFKNNASSIKPTNYSLRNEKSSTDTNTQKRDFQGSFVKIKMTEVNETKIVYHEIHCDYHAKQLSHHEIPAFSFNKTTALFYKKLICRIN